MSIFPQAWIQVLARKCGIPFLDVVSPRVPGNPNRRPQRPGEINAGSTFCGAQRGAGCAIFVRHKCAIYSRR